MRHLAFKVLFTAQIKGGLCRVCTVKLEINTFDNKSNTFSSNILDSVGYKIFIFLVPICKTAISIITSVAFKVGRVYW